MHGGSGGTDLGPLDVLVLHTVNHRDRPKKLADICFTLNIEDTHSVNYALKKLLKQGLVTADRQGKNASMRRAKPVATPVPDTEVRDACLIETLTALGTVDTEEIGDAARVLRAPPASTTAPARRPACKCPNLDKSFAYSDCDKT